MKVTLKDTTCNIEAELGDAIVFEDNSIRVIVRSSKGYSVYCPENDMVYYKADTIEELLERYDKIIRVIKKMI